MARALIVSRGDAFCSALTEIPTENKAQPHEQSKDTRTDLQYPDFRLSSETA